MDRNARQGYFLFFAVFFATFFAGLRTGAFFFATVRFTAFFAFFTGITRTPYFDECGVTRSITPYLSRHNSTTFLLCAMILSSVALVTTSCDAR